MMRTKKINPDMKKLACVQPFSVKQATNGVFIEGFANKATVDRGDEIIATDAWELDNYKRNPIILFNHGMDSLGGTPVGKATEVRPTEEGLYLKVKLSNSQSPGIRMVRDLVEERILKAFSVGFNPKQVDTMEIDGKSVRKISKAELFEVSIVGVPMNQDSLFELSEKALKTKSLHELKGEILKAKHAESAAKIEEIIGNRADRRTVITLASETLGITVEAFLDMLAGDTELAANAETVVTATVKKLDLVSVLEQSLAALDSGKTQEEVLQELQAKLGSAASGEDEQEEGGEEEAKGEDAEGGDGAGETEEEEDKDPTQEADAKLKKDFQDCVNEMVPKLLQEGMDQDQAVAAAISKCQEEGKCQLTPESRLQVYDALTSPVAQDFKMLEVLSFEKQVGEEVQGEQAPTTPIKTEPNPDDFGSPYLEAAKQTNVLLGTLISEIQKLNNKVDGLVSQSPVQSEEEESTEQEASSTDDKAIEDHVKKRLEALDKKLQSLGC